MYAADGQNLWSQDDATQNHWIRTYGSEQAANAAWVAEHNREIGGDSGDGDSGGGDSGGGSDSHSESGSMVNPDAVNQAYLIASAQAQQEYLNAKLDFEKHQFSHLSAYQKEQLSFERAKFKFERSYQTALLTGTWKGKPTWQKQKDMADITGYFKGKATLEREQFQAGTAQGYLNLMAGLRGPRNAFQYAKVLAGTPQGMQDIIRAAAGQYALPGTGGGNPNAQMEAASLQGLFEDAQTGQMGGYYDDAGNPIPSPTGAQASGVSYTGEPSAHDSGGLGPTAAAQAALPPVTVTDDQTPDPLTLPTGGATGTALGPQGTGTNPALFGMGSRQKNKLLKSGMTWMDIIDQHGEDAPEATHTAPPGVQAPVEMWNHEYDGQGGSTSYPPGVSAPPGNTQYSTMSATNPGNAGWMPYDPARPGQAKLQPSNQWNAKNIANMGQYQRDLLLAAHEAEGGDPGAVWDEFQKSLPKYGGPARGRIATS